MGGVPGVSPVATLLAIAVSGCDGERGQAKPCGRESQAAAVSSALKAIVCFSVHVELGIRITVVLHFDLASSVPLRAVMRPAEHLAV